MAQVYGVTADSVTEQYFPTAHPLPAVGKVTTSSVAKMIEGVSASVNAVVRAAGVLPDSVSETAHAEAWAYLADTVRLGTAVRVAQVGMLGVEADAVKAWRAEFEARLQQLREDPGTWLPGLVDPAAGGGDVFSHVTDPTVGAREPEFHVDDEN